MKKISAALLGLGLLAAVLLGAAAPAGAAPATGQASGTIRSISATVIGIEFQHANWQGATYTINGGNCTGTTGDVDWQLGSLASGWNDIISSYRTYANCWARHFENGNFGGASVGFSGDQAYIGDALNDKTSSIQWS